MNEILNKIKQYNTIIIHRHDNPDCDALGSQLGLKYTLKENFKDKEIYAVGDMNRFDFLGKMDEIPDEKYQNALVIICDVAVGRMVSDKRYFLAKEVIVIDHHKNDCLLDSDGIVFDKPLYKFIRSDLVACAEIIAMMLEEWQLSIPKEAATALYAGMVTDSGRFQYGSNLEHLFKEAAFVVKNGADAQYVYKNLYVETLEDRLMKNYFSSKMLITKENVAYMINEADVFDKFDVDTFTVSRGMVNLMAGIKGINIWANFTFDKNSGKYFGEFRSRDIVIVDIAKKYGGGGHENACGATLEKEQIALILEDFNKLAKEFRENA